MKNISFQNFDPFDPVDIEIKRHEIRQTQEKILNRRKLNFIKEKSSALIHTNKGENYEG